MQEVEASNLNIHFLTLLYPTCPIVLVFLIVSHLPILLEHYTHRFSWDCHLYLFISTSLTPPYEPIVYNNYNSLYYKMKSINLLVFLLTFCFSLSSACIIFSANLDSAKDFAATGSIYENGKAVCTWNSKVGSEDQYWLQCNDGYSAFVTKDFNTLAYSRANGDFRISLRIDRINADVLLLWGNQDSCGCTTPNCKSWWRIKYNWWISDFRRPSGSHRRGYESS